MTAKRAIIGSTALISVVMTVYFTYFNHGSSEDILARNLAQQSLHGEHTVEDYDYDEDNLSQVSRVMWNRFINENNFVSIGELFSSCDGEEKIMLGRTILLPDKEKGGVKTRTYVNVTWAKEIEFGELHIDVTYNSKSLYNNHFDLCTVDEDEEDRLIVCPIKKGLKFYKKELKIPNYLPKGEYSSKAWITDADKKVVLCGSAKFKL